MATYYAISSENVERNGWTILARADSPDTALHSAAGDDVLLGTDIIADTWRKNLRVVSKTALLRLVGRARYTTMFDDFACYLPWTVAARAIRLTTHRRTQRDL